MPINLRQSVKRAITGNRKVLGCSYDYLFRNAAGSIKLDVPDFEGRFEIDIRSHILRTILVSGEYEPEAAQFISKHVDQQRDAIDVGANIGLFTMKMLAAGARRVLAVEPMPGALHYLKQNIFNNGRDSRVVLHEGVVGTECGETVMHYVPGKEEYSSIGPLHHPSVDGMKAQCLTVRMETLDRLIDASALDPAIVKIDTEESEYLVLGGARNMLEKHRPVLIMERWGKTHKEVDCMLAECGYVTRAFAANTIVAAHRTVQL